LATGITHIVVAGVAGKAFTRGRVTPRFWIATTACSLIPDLDVIGFWFGVRYADFLGHRGFFHSILFALLVAVFFGLVFFRKTGILSRRWLLYVTCFFLVGASHGILDAMTDGGLGVALFSPFDDTRYFLAWRPIKVAPIGIGAIFSRWGMQSIWSEIRTVWGPLFVILAVIQIIKISWDRFRKPEKEQ
jgi:inner membrane protein